MARIHTGLRLWMEVGGLLAEIAEGSAKALRKQTRPRRRGSYETRRPGDETLMWNACVAMLRDELKPYGSKARLARYLGIPKQRLTDYLKGQRRMPDAEAALQMLEWVAQKRAGRDLSL